MRKRSEKLSRIVGRTAYIVLSFAALWWVAVRAIHAKSALAGIGLVFLVWAGVVLLGASLAALAAADERRVSHEALEAAIRRQQRRDTGLYDDPLCPICGAAPDEECFHA